MVDLTKLAKGRDCQIRCPGRCDRDTATVVLAHYRMPGLSGIGMKSPNWAAAFSCSSCHAIVDGQRGSWIEFPQQSRDLMLLEGVIRTLAILIDEGVIVVGGEASKPSKIFRRRA